MRSRILVGAFATFALASNMMLMPALAQQQGGSTTAAANSGADIYPPSPADTSDSNADVITVPIPGGGEVQAEEPPPVTQSTLPPTENWATQQTNPNSVGVSPIGP